MKKVIISIIIIASIATLGYIIFDALSGSTRNVPSTAKLVTPEQENMLKQKLIKLL